MREVGPPPTYHFLYYFDKKIRTFRESEKGFKIAKYEGGWLSEKDVVLILHPKHANDVLQMTFKQRGEWLSTAPEGFYRDENRKGKTYYSTIAFAAKAPGKFPNHQKIRIMEGVGKFLEGQESPTNFYKTYEEWYQDIWMRLTNKHITYPGFVFMKCGTNGRSLIQDRSYEAIYILHKTNAEKALVGDE